VDVYKLIQALLMLIQVICICIRSISLSAPRPSLPLRSFVLPVLPVLLGTGVVVLVETIMQWSIQ
jgi:hypothetical protein